MVHGWSTGWSTPERQGDAVDVNHDIAPPDCAVGAIGPEVSVSPESGDAAAMAAVVDPTVEAALDALVAEAPPLSYEVRMRLAHLLRHHEPPPHERGAARSTGRGVDTVRAEPAADVEGRGGAAGAAP
jgi:hypothetical protein